MHQKNEVFIHTLERNQHLSATLFRIPEDSSVCFTYGPSLFGESIKFFINYPTDGPLDQSNYNTSEWTWRHLLDETTQYIRVQFGVPGSYSYFFLADGEQLSDTCCTLPPLCPQAVDIFKAMKSGNIGSFPSILGSGFILVDPIIYFGFDQPNLADINLNTNGIRCQTVISKLLGPLGFSWLDKLQVAYESGYNMIHFTPVQELGASQSAYCIKDHFKLNSSFGSVIGPAKFDGLAKIISHLLKQWKMTSVTDIVLNHTANETPWLLENPDVAYNLINSPHLKAPFLFDRALYQVTVDIESGKLPGPKEITSEHDISCLREIFHSYVTPLNLYEFYLFNVDDALTDARKILVTMNDQVNREATNTPQKIVDVNALSEKVTIIQPSNVKRLQCKVDLTSLLHHLISCNSNDNTSDNQGDKVDYILDIVKQILHVKRDKIITDTNDHIKTGIENVLSAIRYERLQAKLYRQINISTPLTMQYFTYPYAECQVSVKFVESSLDKDDIASLCMAHNGWIMNWNPLHNFAESKYFCYLRREIISWGDSCKLRYGSSPQDNPLLWEKMEEYVKQTARLFHGIRLDNCHATPIHVAKYMIDAARSVKDSIYVFAELFTSSETADNIFINHLGINSLIRESLSANDSHDLGRLIHRFGGNPVGSFVKTSPRPLTASSAHAIFFDQTHDNESIVSKRTAYDLLPSSALIAMADAAIASNRGYDEIVPYHIHVVKENRAYAHWLPDSPLKSDCPTVNSSTGIIWARTLLNNLHSKLCNEFTEIYVDQVDPNVLAITRFNPTSNESVVLIARTCFTHCDPGVTGFIRDVEISGHIKCVLFESKMKGSPSDFTDDPAFITGLRNFKCEQSKLNFPVEQSSLVTVTKCQSSNGAITNYVKFNRFQPSSIIAFSVELSSAQQKASQNIYKLLQEFNQVKDNIIDTFTLITLNYCLFKCDSEEKDSYPSSGVYCVPNFGSFNYAGLAGLMVHWKNIRTNNDLGHPICDNLRSGDWLLEYYVNRFNRLSECKNLAQWLNKCLLEVKILPRYLVPRYFDIIITGLYSSLIDHALHSMSPFVFQGDEFVKKLAISSLALIGETTSARLPRLSSAIDCNVSSTVTMAAGLPHFATGYMRCWGRDTFISMRGLLLATGRFNDARNIILGFAGAMRHGLIPNLLDGGDNCRYNCRDAVWWWLNAIKTYCFIKSDDNHHLLSLPVRRLYPSDDTIYHEDNCIEEPLHKVMYEAISRHFSGIEFKERNHGKKIDEHMTDAGFTVTAGVDKETGFIYGGNKWNCGTWMDKMGSSIKAGTKGVPSSPRDGSAVEIIGLSWSVIGWLVTLDSSVWPYTHVSHGDHRWTWLEWTLKIRDNFEKHFWIPSDSSHPLTNRREIYKDTVNSSDQWRDFQLRPNFVIPMAIAPQLFDKQHARAALANVQNILMSNLGMKTLDPSDWNYRGDYDNSNDSDDPSVAHGFNYHQGPEWLWPVGYYLRARFNFAEDVDAEVVNIKRILSRHYSYIMSDKWMGLPELTNSNGSHCRDSCTTQAWSVATLLDVLFHLHRAMNRESLLETMAEEFFNVSPLTDSESVSCPELRGHITAFYVFGESRRDQLQSTAEH